MITEPRASTSTSIPSSVCVEIGSLMQRAHVVSLSQQINNPFVFGTAGCRYYIIIPEGNPGFPVVALTLNVT